MLQHEVLGSIWGKGAGVCSGRTPTTVGCGEGGGVENKAEKKIKDPKV